MFKRYLMLITISLLFFCMCGCEEVFINRGDLTEVKEGVLTLSQQIDAGQALWTEVAEITGKNVEETAAINKKIDEYQPMLTEAATQLAEAPTLIEGLIEANKTTAPINPYAGIIDLILKLLVPPTIVGGGIAVNKAIKTGKENNNLKTEVDVVKRKYTAGKRGLDDLRMKHSEDFKESYEFVGNTRAALGV